MTATAAHTTASICVLRDFFLFIYAIILQPSSFSDLTDTTLETKKVKKNLEATILTFQQSCVKILVQISIFPKEKKTVQDLAYKYVHAHY